MSTTIRRRSQYSCGTQLITKQSHKQECDINYILTQFKKTGIITHISNQTPVYDDLPDQFDYQSSLNLLQAAGDSFSALPSVVRRYFDNDPALLLAALHNPEMRSKLEELGILKGPDNPRPAGNPVNRDPVVDPGHEPKLP